jgi:integrase
VPKVKKSSKSNSKAGAANPLTETVQTVSGMPTKLKIFKVASSRFWWVRVFLSGRYRMSTLKTEKLREAQEAAKKFFYQALLDAELGTGRATGKSMTRSFVSVGSKFIESQNVPDKPRRYNDDRIRFNKELVPYFAEKDVGDISNADIGALAKQMQQGGRSPATVNQYLIVLRKILKYAADNRLIASVPNFPKVKGKGGMTKRDYFELQEYEALVKTIEQMAGEGVKVRGVTVTLEYKYLVQFMVNSFIRPSDLRVIRNEHVHVMKNSAAKNMGDQKYLLLKHPATKTTDQEVVTMPAAHGVYQSLRKLQLDRGFGKSKDLVFFPEYENRNTMIAVAGRIFSAAVKRAGLVQEGEKHTLYSLRHTSIMYRLLLGKTSTLELARNARTSQAMIDKHYASRLTPMMAVESIHSFKPTAPAKKARMKAHK